jgi:hypothetical protein
MSDRPSLDPAYVAAMSVVVVVMAAIFIQLIPILFQAVWQILPGVLIIVLIVGALRGMLKKLFD